MNLKILILFILVLGYNTIRAYASRGIAVESNASGCLELFYIDAGNALVYKKQQFPGKSWSEAKLISVSVSGVFLFKKMNGCLMLFYTRLDGRLYYNYQRLPDYQWNDAQEFAAHVVHLDAIADAENNMNIFYSTTDNRLIQRFQLPSGDWSDEIQRAGFAKRIAAARNEDGRLELFYTVLGDTLHHQYQLAPGGAWSDGNYFSLPAKDLEVTRNEDGRLEVFFIDQGDMLQHKWQVAINSGWGGPAVFAGYARKVMAAKNHDERLEVFYTADNNYIHHKWQTAVNSGWSSGEQYGWVAGELAATLNHDGRLEVFYTGTDGLLFHNWQLQPGMFWSGEYPFFDEDHPVISFESHDPMPNYIPETNWHVNDHCFILDGNNYWHMFGIVYPDPYSGDHSYVNYFGHAGAAALNAVGWSKMDPPFYETLQEGDVLWAPHIICFENLYYMFYCGGGTLDSYEICLRTSPDLINWSDYQVLFRDGIQARDPMVLWLEAEQCWVMYYTATLVSSGGYHVVAYRTSYDLVNWSERNIAYTDYHSGTTYGNTESPFVVKRGEYYYLFTGPRPYDPPTESLPNWEHPGYAGTDIFRSVYWNKWTNADIVGHIDVHAPEIIRNTNGDWYASHCGVLQGGLFIRKINWHDGISAGLLPVDEPAVLFQLEDNFPNPFIHSTIIKFRLLQTSTLSLKVYDIKGRLVDRIINDRMKPGCHEVIWNAADLAPGIYYCRLDAGSITQCRKMVKLPE